MKRASRVTALLAARRMRGVTLIELVVAIAVVAVAIVGVAGALSAHATHSADRMIRQQAAAIASSYLEEILQKSYVDPDGVGEASRSAYDNVADYNGLVNNGAQDQFGNAVAGLDQFRVSVSVGAGALGGIPAADARLIVVTVRHSTGRTVIMSGYRTRYP